MRKISSADRKHLRKILVIGDPKLETIFGIVERMKVLLDYLQSHPHHHGLVPFLETYYLVTKTVAEKRLQSPSYFRNPRALEELDIYFASLYFGPLLIFLETGKCQTPWRQYFQYCKSPVGVPFLQMLLGINAHINTDLPDSVVALHYRQRADFLKINAILQEEIPSIMVFLAFAEHDLFGFSALVFRRFVNSEFHHLIVKWRELAWRNAGRATRTNWKPLYFQVARQTETIASELIDAFHVTRLIESAKILDKVNNLRVHLG